MQYIPVYLQGKIIAMKPLNVLLIDDDEDDREVFSSAIAMMDECPDCIVLEDAAAALLKLEKKLLTPDVIFLDLNMPRMDGRDFLIKIKEKESLAHIPIVLFSTSSYLESVKSDTLKGTDFIAKPDSFRELKTILQEYLYTNFQRLRPAS